jgi:dephospho-CoA kinase
MYMGRKPLKPRELKRFVIGVTGKMLSGKNVLCDVLSSRGFKVIDADSVGHQSLEIRKEEIIKMIDGDIVDPKTQNIDRKKLANIVFSDPMKLKILNKLVHGTIKELIRLMIGKDGFYCINAALLFEIGLDEFCDIIVYVESSEKEILKRASLRGFSEEEVKKRIKFQKTLEEVKDKVDIIIYNNSSLEDFKKEIEEKIFSIVKM